jgi:transposase-like protein
MRVLSVAKLGTCTSTSAEKIHGRGPEGKAIVFGLLDRETRRVHARVIGTRRKHGIHKQIRENVAPGAELNTDDLRSYDGLDEYTHKVIDHAEAYVDGTIHTNGLENFWSLLKRAIKGTYVSVEPFHLFPYLDEQTFRFNEHKETDATRFQKVLNSAGKRLTWNTLTCRGVMSNTKDKSVEEKPPERKKPPGYRNFERLLKQVIKAPPMPPRGKRDNSEAEEPA